MALVRQVQVGDTCPETPMLGPHLSVTSWGPRSTGSEVATDEGVGRGAKAAVVQNQKRPC